MCIVKRAAGSDEPTDNYHQLCSPTQLYGVLKTKFNFHTIHPKHRAPKLHNNAGITLMPYHFSSHCAVVVHTVLSSTFKMYQITTSKLPHFDPGAFRPGQSV